MSSERTRPPPPSPYATARRCPHMLTMPLRRASTHLRLMPTLVSTLEVMALTHDVGPLLRYLLPHLVRATFACGSGEPGRPRDLRRRERALTFVLSAPDETLDVAVLASVLRSLPLTGGLDRTAAR